MKKLLLLLVAVTLVGCNAPKFDQNTGNRPADQKLDQMIKDRVSGAVDAVEEAGDAALDAAGDAVDAAVDAGEAAVDTAVDAGEAVVDVVTPEDEAALEASAAIEADLADEPIIVIE